MFYLSRKSSLTGLEDSTKSTAQAVKLSAVLLRQERAFLVLALITVTE